jgi:hypothetical protein
MCVPLGKAKTGKNDRVTDERQSNTGGKADGGRDRQECLSYRREEVTLSLWVS